MPRFAFRTTSLVAIGLVVLGVSACNTSKEVTVNANEFKFESAVVTFAKDQPYRFVVKNTGAQAHEWVLDEAGGGADHDHSTGHSHAIASIKDTALKPGATVSQDVVFKFAGEYEMACHLPGHYEAGMKLLIKVQ